MLEYWVVTVDILSIVVCSRGAARVGNERNKKSSRLSSKLLQFPKLVDYHDSARNVLAVIVRRF